MPLAVDSERLGATASYQQRRDAGLDRLRENLKPPLNGVMYDGMVALLAADVGSAERVALLVEIEALDGSESLRQALASYWLERYPVGSGVEMVRGPVEGQREVGKIAGVEFAWRFIPPGTFQMGSPTDEAGRYSDEGLHEVTLTRGFWMGETEVTQGQWEAVMGNNPSYFKKCGTRCPVEEVSWYEALAFANALSEASGLEPCYEFPGGDQEPRFTNSVCGGYRLPTEAEWEYAARAGEQRAIYTRTMTNQEHRNSPELYEVAWYRGNSGTRTHPVGQKKKNAWGLADMLGNVWEWVWDRKGTYWEKAVADPSGSEEGSYRVFRGGGWNDFARLCRAANRGNGHPNYWFKDLGFRLVRTLP